MPSKSSSFTPSHSHPSSPPPPPQNWPRHLPYLTSPLYSPTLTPTHFTILRTSPEIPNSPSELKSKGPPAASVKITPIPSSSPHPAAGQAGLFAGRALKAGTFVVEYLGVIHGSPSSSSSSSPSSASVFPSESQPQEPTAAAAAPPAAAAPAAPPTTTTTRTPTTPTEKQDQPHNPHANSDYDLSLDRYHGLAIDAAGAGNEARFINDYRGVRERPNAEFRELWHPLRKERGMGVWVLPVGKSGKGKGGIRKGEEIVVSYGRGFWGARRDEG